MANGTQIERNIRHAQEKVAQFGYLNRQEVSDREVMLAGFGHIADVIREREKNTVRVQFDGKKFLAVGMTLGGVIVGVVQRLVAGG